MKGENLVGNFKKTLAGMMAFCLLMSTLTPRTPWLPLAGKALRPPPSTLPFFAFFYSNLPFSALKRSKLFTISHF